MRQFLIKHDILYNKVHTVTHLRLVESSSCELLIFIMYFKIEIYVASANSLDPCQLSGSTLFAKFPSRARYVYTEVIF